MLGRVARGELQIHSAVSVQLPADEICYLEVPAKRWRYLQSGAHYTTGNLIVTNKKIRFSAAQHGGEIPLSRVMNAKILDAYSLALETTSPSMAGNYSVGDAVWDSAIINAAIKRDRQK